MKAYRGLLLRAALGVTAEGGGCPHVGSDGSSNF